jgi:hypothetical protein
MAVTVPWRATVLAFTPFRGVVATALALDSRPPTVHLQFTN